ncbi:MAG: VWA domain-containing protein, partial [bacterium]|nr:VWA domain-containing protein [bacterium]
PGGWHKTPIENLLPIEFVQKEEKRDPSTTLVIIIDTSGSMGGNRVQLAKEVSRLAIRRLLPHDKVGLVEFYGAKRWAVPIQPASNAIEIERALNRLNAGGGTVILPAIEEAFYGLKNVRTRYKHVLILTDGGVETGAFEPLLRSMSEDGINVSTVLIGSAAHSEFLVTLANWGKGRFYGVPNRFNLPEILLKQPTTAKLPAMRPGPHVVNGRGGPAWWGEVDAKELPQLGAYVETSVKAGAHKVIETEGEGHPVLASWNNGLGRVTTLTTEPTGPASEGWQQWQGYGPMLARALEQTARDSEPFRFSIERDDWRIRITARSRFGDLGVAFPGARIAGADADAADIDFRRLAPGWFEAEFFADPSEEVRLHVGDTSKDAELKGLAVSPALADVSNEFAVDPSTDLDLALLANETGGTHGPLSAAGGADTELPTTGGGTTPQRRKALWPLALLLALAFYLIEILNRRLVNGLFNRGNSNSAGTQA